MRTCRSALQLTLLLATSAAVAAEPLRVSTHFGLAGFHRLGDTLPIRVALENDGPPAEVTLVVPMDPQPAIVTTVKLPTRSKKQVFVYVPLRGSDFVARMESNPTQTVLQLNAYWGRHRIARARIPYAPTVRTVYAVAVVDEPSFPVTLLDGKLFQVQQTDPTTVELQPPTALRFAPGLPRMPGTMGEGIGGGSPGPPFPPPFTNQLSLPLALLALTNPAVPDHPAGLEALDALLLKPGTWLKLTAPQQRAVRTWVEQGGVLLLFGGTAAERDRLGELLPRRTGALDSQGLGFGGIGVTEVDFTAQTFVLSAEAEATILQHLTRLVDRHQRSRLGESDYRITASSQFLSANISEDPNVTSWLRRLRGVKPPPRWALAAIAGLYLLVFGPLNVVLIRRVRRSERAWLLTPGLSVVYALFLLALGQAWGGGQSVLSQFSVLECRAGSTTAREETVLGLFSAVHRRYTLRVGDATAFLEDKTAEEEERPSSAVPQQLFMPRSNNQQLRNLLARRQVLERAERFPPAAAANQITQSANESVWSNLPLSAWTFRRYRTSRVIALDGAVTLLVRPDLSGEVINGTSHSLQNCLLALNRFRCDLGELPPGASRPVRSEQWRLDTNPSAMANATEAAFYGSLPTMLVARAGQVTLFGRLKQPLLRVEAAVTSHRLCVIAVTNDVQP